VRAALIPLLLLFFAGCDSCGNGNKADAIDGAPTNTDPDAAPVNATPIPTASVAKFLNPDNLPAYTGETGSVEGTVTVKGLPAPETPGDFHRCPDAEKTWGKLFREGPNRALADVIVAVTDRDTIEVSLLGSYNAAAMRLAVDLRLRAWQAAQQARGRDVELELS